MMKKGISKQVFTYVVVLVLLALLAVYMLGYKKYMTMATEKQTANAAMEKEIESLKVYYINEAQYKADMVPMTEEIHAIMDQFPADILEEDVIMHAVKTQMGSEIVYSNINISENEAYQEVGEDVVLATAQEDMQTGISFMERTGTYVNELDYTNLKKSIQAVFDSQYNIGIKKITYSRVGDDTPLLNGTLELAFYSMVGNGKEYQKPDMMPYENGSTNIFGILYINLDEEGNIIFGESAEEVGIE